MAQRAMARSDTYRRWGWLAPVVIAWAVAVASPGATAQNTPSQPEPAAGVAQGSGLPIPRFVILKSDRVHLRQGPGFDHKVQWIFRRAGLPVEVIQEFEGWRQVRDAEGTTGWLLQSLVSGRRTALILPWEAKAAPVPQVEVRDDDKAGARAVAVVEAGVIANVRSCDGQWCYVSVGDYRGYVEQKKLWGVYDGERVR